MLHYQGWSIASTKVTLEPISSAIIKNEKVFPRCLFFMLLYSCPSSQRPHYIFHPSKASSTEQTRKITGETHQEPPGPGYPPSLMAALCYKTPGNNTQPSSFMQASSKSHILYSSCSCHQGTRYIFLNFLHQVPDPAQAPLKSAFISQKHC